MPKGTGKLELFNKSIVGNWDGASDGFKSADGEAKTSNRNFSNVNDDATKVYNSNDVINNDILHQGALGSRIGFGYRAGTGDSHGNVNGPFIHRITQSDSNVSDKSTDNFFSN